MTRPRATGDSARKASPRPRTVAEATLAWPARPPRLRPRLAAEPRRLRLVERAGGDDVRLVRGDVLEVASALGAEGLCGQVDCVYVDPPFLSQLDYVAEARLDGAASGRTRRAVAYEDTWAGGVVPYLEMLAPRLEALAALLAPTGTLWVHLDWRAAYLVRVLLDEIMGRAAFLNEIVWRRAPNLGRQAQSHQFGRTLDTLVVYGGRDAQLTPPTRLEPIEPRSVRRDGEGRPFIAAPRGDYTDASVARLEREGRIHRTASGKVYVKYFLVEDGEGRLCRERRVDALWDDVAPMRHRSKSERTGYPTQKPRALLERVLESATKPGGLVLDGFAGSGTTAAAAHALGRRAIVVDQSAVAVATARARLLREGARLSSYELEGEAARPTLEVKAALSASGRELELLEPREPLAWSVGRRGEAGAVVTSWHGERVPGVRTEPAPTRAPLAGSGPWVVSAWGDDGAFGELSLSPAATARGGLS